MKIIFEILTDSGSPIFNSIRDYSEDTPQSKIHSDFTEWKEYKMKQIESYWGPYGRTDENIFVPEDWSKQ